MILYNEIFPSEVDPLHLDFFLAKGWYRRRSSMFTTNVEWLGPEMEWKQYKVWWIRYNLLKWNYTNEAKRILKKNKPFSYNTSPVEFNTEVRTLFEKYKTGIDFQLCEQPEDYLYHDNERVFMSEMLKIRDGNSLVAAGIFDRGEKSIAGILNFYDPAYNKYSPGKFLMLLKMELAKKEGKEYYYPGYVVQDYPKFDYKLFPCNNSIEYYSWTNDAWLDFSKKSFLAGNFVG